MLREEVTKFTVRNKEETGLKWLETWADTLHCHLNIHIFLKFLIAFIPLCLLIDNLYFVPFWRNLRGLFYEVVLFSWTESNGRIIKMINYYLNFFYTLINSLCTLTFLLGYNLFLEFFCQKNGLHNSQEKLWVLTDKLVELPRKNWQTFRPKDVV